MSTAATIHAQPATDSSTRPSVPARERQSLARRVLFDALFLGSLGDALLHDGFAIGLTIWMAVAAATIVYSLRQRGQQLNREQWAWMGTALFFAAVFGWRDSAPLLFYDFVAMLAALAMFAATVSRGGQVRTLLGQSCRSLFFVLQRAVADGGFAVLKLMLASGVDDIPRSWKSGSPAVRAFRAALLALPVLLVFGLLFGAADPLFVSILSLPHIEVGTAVSHLFVAGVMTWVVGGWLFGAVVDVERRTVPATRFGLSLGTIEITTILGGLVTLFGLFVAVQIGWLFGGERLVRATTGLGYAEYARHGFFELVTVAVLIVPVLLGTRGAVSDDDAAAIRRHRLLAVPLLLLMGGVMASALGRMALYVHYYGLSTDRLFASVFMLWLAVVLLWFGLTTLRDKARDFAAGMAITGFLTLAALNVANPDVLVARVNVARAPAALRIADSLASDSGGLRHENATPSIDYMYLTQSLGGDAVGVLLPALIAPPVAAPGSAARGAEVRERCRAVNRLMERWLNDTRNRDWRGWSLSRLKARRAITRHEAELRQVTCVDASGETPFGDRDSRPARPGEQWYRVGR